MSAPAVHEPAVHGRGTVAVGYDGSETAQQAVNWAVSYAADAGLNLRVVHAWVWPVFTKNLGPVKGVAGSGLRHSAETILAEGVELARSAAAAASGTRAADVEPPAGLSPGEAGPQPTAEDGGPEFPSRGRGLGDGATRTAGPGTPGGPAVEGVIGTGLPAPVLREASRDARLLVVGSRGIGAVLGPLAGSVCLELAGSAPCPLMAIRRPRSPGRPVVVGIDASSRSPGTLAEAVRLAEVLRAPLLLVHVDPLGPRAAEEHGRHAPLHGQELLDRAVDDARKSAPGLDISGLLRKGHAASRELLAAAAEADALVIGTHNPAAGPGNTVSAVLHKARCNVLISR
ncbi:universal stress protein [Arthrobacter sp. ov118]|uniref:universal stress protein n=1 Tax=Arthrobacter sp. ov118 TaxID=1761747 RepID=UPI0008EB60EA|nr:universal stress protein [Arthrobacter sp. ov118]SFT80633.1 Nucleotide-binding universal stress protein, UspA family [Arthrobacter sp. ov118]